MRKLFLIALIAIESISYAFINHINVMYNSALDQTVYLIGDVHLPSQVAVQQRSDLLWFLKMLENSASNTNQGVYCIVEDMLSANHEHPVIEQYIQATRKQSPDYWHTQLLTGFADDCQHRSIPFCNIEHRQLTTFSFSGWPISANAVIDQFYASVEKIRSFDLCPSYNQIFQEYLDEYEQTVLTPLRPYLETLRSDDVPFGKMLDNAPYDPCIDQVIAATNPGYAVPEGELDRKCFMCDFWDVSWPDLLIAGEIGTHPDTKTIVVVAGGGHTLEVTEILKKVGFQMQCQHQASLPIKDITEDELTIDMQEFFNCHAPQTAPLNTCARTLPPQDPPHSNSLAALLWAFICTLVGTSYVHHMIICPIGKQKKDVV